MAEPTYDEVLKTSLNSKLFVVSSTDFIFMIKFLCNVEVKSIREISGLNINTLFIFRIKYNKRGILSDSPFCMQWHAALCRLMQAEITDRCNGGGDENDKKSLYRFFLENHLKRDRR